VVPATPRMVRLVRMMFTIRFRPFFVYLLIASLVPSISRLIQHPRKFRTPTTPRTPRGAGRKPGASSYTRKRLCEVEYSPAF